MNSVVLSVIVPVYNGEDTLDRCIKSIVKQDYKDFELIIINDGSDDRSLEIANHYATEDGHVKVLSQENQGVSAARNLGIQNANGKWITFVDADDYLDNNCFKAIMENDSVANMELVLWDRVDVYKNRTEEKVIFVNDEWKNISTRDLITKVFYNQNGNLEICSVYCRLFRRDILCKQNIWFDKSMSMGEDMVFMLDYLKVIKHFSYIHKGMYYRSMYEKSAMHGFNTKMDQSVILLLKKIQGHIDFTEYRDSVNAFRVFVLRGPVTTFLESYLCNSQNKNSRKQRRRQLYIFLKTKVVDENIRKIRYRDLSNRLRVKLFCVRHGCMIILDHWYQTKEYI